MPVFAPKSPPLREVPDVLMRMHMLRGRLHQPTQHKPNKQQRSALAASIVLSSSGIIMLALSLFILHATPMQGVSWLLGVVAL